MIKAGKWIAKHKKLILFIGLVLLVPSVFGYVSTRVNYDVLSYLPETLETVEGQDIMVDEFGMGAFSMVVVEDMGLKDVAALKEKIQNVDHVEDVLWYDSVMDLSVPIEMLPKDLKEGLFKGNATMMIALFDNTFSFKHWNCYYLQHGNKYIFGRDFLYYPGSYSGSSAWCDDGLFYIPSELLRG